MWRAEVEPPPGDLVSVEYRTVFGQSSRPGASGGGATHDFAVARRGRGEPRRAYFASSSRLVALPAAS